MSDPKCAACGHSRSNHPYRHRFVGPSLEDDVKDLEAKLAKAVEGQKIKALEQILEERGAVFDAMVDAAEDAAGKDVSFNVVVGRALRAAIAEIKGESHE